MLADYSLLRLSIFSSIYAFIHIDLFTECSLSLADDGTLNTANDNIDNIRRDLQQSLYDVSGWCCRNRMALNPTKTKCMLMATRQKHQKKTAPFKSKVRDHANRASFKTSPTWSDCRRTAKLASTY